jgi:hypothetical protein
MQDALRLAAYFVIGGTTSSPFGISAYGVLSTAAAALKRVVGL